MNGPDAAMSFSADAVPHTRFPELAIAGGISRGAGSNGFIVHAAMGAPALIRKDVWSATVRPIPRSACATLCNACTSTTTRRSDMRPARYLSSPVVRLTWGCWHPANDHTLRIDGREP